MPSLPLRLRLISLITACFCTVASGQIMEVILPTGGMQVMRKGFIVTQDQDTIWALISYPADTVIFYIMYPYRVSESVSGYTTKLPFLLADDPRVKSFTRNGIRYEPHNVAPLGKTLYLAVVNPGPLTLYAWYVNFSDQGSYETNETEEYQSKASFFTNFHDESFAVKEYYLRKGDSGEVVQVPRYEKKFRDVFIPLVKDSPSFIRSLAGSYCDYDHLEGLVEKYNRMFQPAKP